VFAVLSRLARQINHHLQSDINVLEKLASRFLLNWTPLDAAGGIVHAPSARRERRSRL
jgi:hypothetical protein